MKQLHTILTILTAVNLKSHIIEAQVTTDLRALVEPEKQRIPSYISPG